jgi:hypothetical protein
MSENTFVVIDTLTGKAVAELSDKTARRVNLKRYRLARPSDYLPTLNAKGKGVKHERVSP